jgi:hypothetical protein
VLNEAIRKLRKAAKEIGLKSICKKLNAWKCKKSANSRMLKVDDQEFERVRESSNILDPR